MKKFLLPLLAGITMLCSCGSIQTSTKGINNEAYLEFISSNSAYFSGVNVTLDNTIHFQAGVTATKKSSKNKTSYAITPGKHQLTVEYNNQTIYSQIIFISNQETKTINLP